MLTSAGFSQGIQNRMSSGWGQSMSFPGPPRMTLENPAESARESDITVEAARLNIPSIPAPNLSITSNPSYSSPVFSFTSNYGNPVNLAFENQMNLQQVEQNVQSMVNTSNDYEARIAALEAWKATGDTACSGTTDIPVLEDWYYDPAVNANNILKMRFRLRIKDGLITSFDGSADSSTACAGTTANALEPVSTCPEGLPTPGGVEFDEVMRIESIGT